MTKNTIMIVIDSVFYDRITKNNFHNSAMPFLYNLAKKGLHTTNMYSEAPYTEAALVSLLSGVDTLKYGGYVKKMDQKTTIMEVFKNNGYDTFFNGFQPHVYPGKSYPGITDMYYNVCFDINSLWSYRFEYYSELYKKKQLDLNYFPLLCNILNDNFEEWLLFFNRLKRNDKTISFIRECINYEDIDTEIKKLTKEYEIFKKGKEKYIKRLFELGKNHEIFNIKTYTLDNKTSLDFREKIYNKHLKTIKKINYFNFKYNLTNNRISIKQLFKNKNQTIQMIKMFKNCIIDKDLFEKIDYNQERIKAAPSMYSHINHFIKWQENRKSTNPYFAYIHVDDCHYPEIFYSYDIEDERKIEREFNKMEDYMRNLPKKYKGSLAYDLSLLYADSCIEYLYNYLKENKLLDNTNIAICADHGSSYTFDPIHENYVRNEYRENYNIPFIFIGKDIKAKKTTNFCNSKDIPATIIDAAKIKIPKCYDGQSLLKYDGKDYAIIQNVNGGCPDYNLRKVWIGIRNKKYAITMEFDMNKSFKNGKIHSIYDLQKDKKESNNLKNNKKINIDKELIILEKHFIELKNDIKKHNFLNNN